MSGKGRTVRVFLVEGDPAGVVTAEILNWTGHVVCAPRSRLAEVRKRTEASRTGVYLLLGDEATTGPRELYVGETDEVGKRLSEHAKDDSKSFFERFCLITSKDQNLTKAHARFVEKRLTNIAVSSGRATVLNKNDPAQGQLPESDIADMDFFVSQLQIILPVLGIDLFRQKAVPTLFAPLPSEVSTPALELIYPKNKHGYEATAYQLNDVLVVRAGSTALRNPPWADSSMNAYRGLRERLIQDGSLVPADDQSLLQFVRDTEFTSPSAAACVIHGGSRNGRYEWRIAGSNQRLKDYEADQLESAS